MRELILIFVSTVLILLVGVFLGFDQFKNSYAISEKVVEMSVPLDVDLDIDFIRKKSF